MYRRLAFMLLCNKYNCKAISLNKYRCDFKDKLLELEQVFKNYNIKVTIDDDNYITYKRSIVEKIYDYFFEN